MYIVFRLVRKGLYRRILITNDVFYANEVVINSDNCHLEVR